MDNYNENINKDKNQSGANKSDRDNFGKRDQSGSQTQKSGQNANQSGNPSKAGSSDLDKRSNQGQSVGSRADKNS